VFLINRNQLGDCLPELVCFFEREKALLQASFAKDVQPGVQRVGATVILFQSVESCQGGAYFCVARPAETRKNRIFFVGGVLRCRLAKITQRGLEGATSVIGQRCSMWAATLSRVPELDPSMTVG
jgi:hypothetical protein